MTEQKKYWFPAKRYGWGWGFPSCWQGWVVQAIYMAVVLALALSRYYEQNPLMFVVWVSIASLILTAICWLKGEPPRWRWGKDRQ
ncbi:hypothetical protein HQ393_03420 [Chitinibacter bivalviorum]|uniref:Uncharacterized protein n=1 Tax=Chitinibacter bivalviorum TaxID=2739434 RepID=A0A7H9BHE9_9NEIS|nr:hypothetical protein [Chitinibacter bivalviorum]QLG87381.1 hypothetical protein HQ393_03420 [Chitinibacter bivalviorum]